MNIRVTFLIVAIYCFASIAKAEQLQTICSPNPTVCTIFTVPDGARFDPFVQHMLVRQQLDSLPTDWRLTHFYIPNYFDQRSHEELQIQFLDQLIQRETAEAETAED